MENIEIHYAEWEERLSQLNSARLDMYCVEALKSLDSKILTLNTRVGLYVRELAFEYNSQVNKMETTFDAIMDVIDYKKNIESDINVNMDDEIFATFNDSGSAIESLDIVSRKEYTTENTLGLQEYVPVYTGIDGYTIEDKKHLTIKDLLKGNIHIEEEHETFYDIFHEMHNSYLQANVDDDELTC